jgi:hypothetical protein
LKKALVPLTAGTLRVPAVSVAYFNPATGAYEQASAGPHALEVLPSAEKEKLGAVEGPGPAGPKEEVKVLGKDILEVRSSLDALHPYRPVPAWLFAVCFLAPMIGFLGIHASRRVREGRASDPGLARSRNAYRNFKKLLPEVKQTLKGSDIRFYQRASRALKDFLGDKLNTSGGALTAAELEARLLPYRVPADTVQSIKGLLEFLDAGQFGYKQHAAQEREAVLKSMKRVAAVLDRKVGK